uniref:G-protein coupled receptors family 1 profile domain-containing protein n=1 Tax=Sus scrofa TaxID=9823 RepID=A0A4X1U112_PIG
REDLNTPTPAWPGSGSLDRLEGVAGAGATLALRALIAGAYLALCAVGLVGNTLVLVLVRAQQRRRRSLLNCFLLNLAATDLQFVLTLPFWAADTVRDFSWPFGGAMCKVVLTLTVLNMYASSFFLSAMSMDRYRTVANALRPRQPGTPWAVCVCCLLWAIAVLATAPTALFAIAARVGDERLCLLRFPDGGPDWLAFYHLQKIAVAFVLPLATLGTCSLLLLRFLRRRRTRWPSGSGPDDAPRLPGCWPHSHSGSADQAECRAWDRAYFLAQAYLFPVSICLAHSNSCLNPLLYCLLRSDFRQACESFSSFLQGEVGIRSTVGTSLHPALSSSWHNLFKQCELHLRT